MKKHSRDPEGMEVSDKVSNRLQSSKKMSVRKTEYKWVFVKHGTYTAFVD